MDTLTGALMAGNAAVAGFASLSLVAVGRRGYRHAVSNQRYRARVLVRRLGFGHHPDCARLKADPTGPLYWRDTGFEESALWRLAERSWGVATLPCGCVADPHGTAWSALELADEDLRARWQSAGFTPVSAAQWLIDTTGDKPVVLRFLREHPETLTAWRDTYGAWDYLDEYTKTALKHVPESVSPVVVDAYRETAAREGWSTAWREIPVDVRYWVLRTGTPATLGDTTTEEGVAA